MREKIDFIVIKKENGETTGIRDILNFIAGLSQGKWVISISKAKKKRSNEQNSYYHAVVVNSVKQGLLEAGYNSRFLTHENVHDFLKGKFLHKDIENSDGEFITVTRSTTDLSAHEFSEFIEEVKQWAAEFLLIYIPDAGEQGKLFNKPK